MRDHHAPLSGGPGAKVAALQGWDLAHVAAVSEPAELLSEGYTLLALDQPAMAALLRDGHAFTTVEDWLSASGQGSEDLWSAPAEIADGWWEHDASLLTTGGVLWPERDHWHEPSVWVGALTALRLARALEATGVSEVLVVEGHPFHWTSPDWYPTRLTANILRRLLPQSVRGIPAREPSAATRMRESISGTALGRAARRMRLLAERRRFRVGLRRLRLEDEGRPTIALLLPGRELDRSGPIIGRLVATGRGSVIAVPWVDSDELAASAGALNPVPWLRAPMPRRGGRSTERRLTLGVRRNLAHHDLGELTPVREELTCELEHFAVRWALHAERLDEAERLLRTMSPALVVVGRDDVTYQVPGEAAKRLGMAILSLPHGVVEWSPPARLQASRSTVHLGGIRNPTAAEGALTLCRDVFITYEYPRRVEPVGTLRRSDGAAMILALTEGTAWTNRASTGFRALEEALLALEAAAVRLGDGVEVKLKPHPGTVELERLAIRDLALTRVTALPREADLLEALAAAKVVIGVNNIGSALVHTVRAGVPLIRFTTHPVIRAETTLPTERPWVEFWDDAALTVHDAATLSDELSRMLHEPGRLAVLKERSSRIGRRLSPGSDARTLEDVLGGLLP